MIELVVYFEIVLRVSRPAVAFQFVTKRKFY
jgi:hypothetical protein